MPYVCWKRGKYYSKVDKNYTSQECPLCGHIHKKKLSVCVAFRRNRKHNCSNCGYQLNQNVAAAPTPIPSREGSKRGG
ncbi:zinc ribbon domain-containing protein [Okeania sp. SIO2B3]|uniref:zinc ribbon domain-containing protein n=1 Tax=Okeania sp. SIO2B3 TaxID=2607784 RepID=UPI0013C01F54|nr:zinc ribbon domain-containing protein [Okeania sp. SIO2B3]NET43783.1 transposase [Okeania sp. SIO2B3]